jgi:transposase
MESLPRNLKSFARSYRPIVVKANKEGINTLLAIEAEVFAIEPTGDYSKIWVESLQKAGRKVRLVSSRRVRYFCEYQGLTNKADRPDAAAIAAYTLENYEREEAFLKVERLKIRDLYLQLNSTTRNKNPIQNRLGQRLSFEFPEIIKTYEGLQREWLEHPSTLYRFLAGESVRGPHYIKRESALANTIGSGLSNHSRELAKHLIGFEEMELQLEEQIKAELQKSEYTRYVEVFDRFLIPPTIRAAILGRIYPFEDFLVDGKPFKEYIRGSQSRRRSGMTKRDRSEGEFKLSLGMGKVLSQSGGTTSWKAGGAKYARTALWLYVRMMVVIKRGKNFSKIASALEKQFHKPDIRPWLNEDLVKAIAEHPEIGTTPEVASLRLHFEFQDGKKGDLRVSSTAGRFCRMLYKSFLKTIG